MENPYKKQSKINPQKENGHREIENSVFHALMKAHLSGAEYQVVLSVLDKSWGFGKPSAPISLSYFMETTRLSRPSVISAVQNLEQKQIIAVKGHLKGKVNEYLFNKHWDTWAGSKANDTIGSKVIDTTLTEEEQAIVKEIALLNSKGNDTTGSKVNHTKVVKETILSIVKSPKLTVALLKKHIKETLKEIYKYTGDQSQFEKLETASVKLGIHEMRKLVFEGLKERRGYNSPLSGAEAKAITWMLNQNYTVEQQLSAYDILKEKPFWSDKALTMPSVAKQIGELLKSKLGAKSMKEAWQP